MIGFCTILESESAGSKMPFVKKAFRSKIFLLDFFSKIFHESEDQLQQIWAFYDLSFLQYNKLNFRVEGFFPLKILPRFSIKKQYFKNWLHVLDSP